MAAEPEPSCHAEHSHHRSHPFYRKPLFIILALLTILLVASFILEALASFRHAFLSYADIMWLPIVLGFLVGGVIDCYIPREYVSKILAQRKKRTVLYSVCFGFLASACSHGVIALSMELHKKGASGPAVISFLLASPWASLPITFLLIGFFHAKAFWIIGAALVIAVATGVLFLALEKMGWIETNKHTVSVEPGFSIRRDIKTRFLNYRPTVSLLLEDARRILKGARDLAGMVLGWVLIGVLLASLAQAFVPENFFNEYFGPTFLGLLVTMALATVLEVCSEGTSPLAFEIYRQTGALGNAFAFLMGGVVTDITEIGLIWSHLGKKTALWMLAATLPQVFILGWIFNKIF